MGRDPAVSIIIPTRNRVRLLEPLLHQVLAIDHPSCEVIVVDEASSDETPAMLRWLSGTLEDPGRLIVLRHEVPVGVAGARNAGTAVARGHHLAWIDDDDLTSRNRLGAQLDALRSTGARWSCAARVDIDVELRIVGHMRCPPPEDLMRRLLAFNCLPTSAQGLVVERDLADEVGDWDTTLASGEDWDYCIRLLERAEPHLLDVPLVGYRTGQPSMSGDGRRMDAELSRVFDKHSARRVELGVEPDWAAVDHSLLAADLRSSRRAAVRRSVRILRRRPSATAALRILAVMISPRVFSWRSARRRAAQVPADWLVVANAWLTEVGPPRFASSGAGPSGATARRRAP